MEWAVRHDHGAVASITLTEPERLNAFTGEDMEALRDLLDALASNASIRAVLLTGAGRAFCSGGDVSSMGASSDRSPPPDEAVARMRRMVEVVELLHGMPKLTIAAVNGPCAGAGLSLALACDTRIAARSATFLTSFVKVGQSGDYGQAWFLERLVGPGWAARLQLLSERVDAEKALRIGLVEELADDDRLRSRSVEVAQAAASMAPSAVAAIKCNLAAASSLPLGAYLDEECRRFVENMGTEDSKTSVRAFVERRPPRFF